MTACARPSMHPRLSGRPPDLGTCPARALLSAPPRLSTRPHICPPSGSTELLALSARGRLMTCLLDPHSEAPCPTRVTVANAGRKIKELLSGIGTVSER